MRLRIQTVFALEKAIDQRSQCTKKWLIGLVASRTIDIWVFAIDRRQHHVQITENDVFGAIATFEDTTRSVLVTRLVMIVITENFFPNVVNVLIRLFGRFDLALTH